MFFSFVLISVFLTFVSACVFALLYTYEGRHLGADHQHCSLPAGASWRLHSPELSLSSTPTPLVKPATRQRWGREEAHDRGRNRISRVLRRLAASCGRISCVESRLAPSDTGY